MGLPATAYTAAEQRATTHITPADNNQAIHDLLHGLPTQAEHIALPMFLLPFGSDHPRLGRDIQ
jgi:hypothetical protein